MAVPGSSTVRRKVRIGKDMGFNANGDWVFKAAGEKERNSLRTIKYDLELCMYDMKYMVLYILVHTACMHAACALRCCRRNPDRYSYIHIGPKYNSNFKSQLQ